MFAEYGMDTLFEVYAQSKCLVIASQVALQTLIAPTYTIRY